MGGTLKTIRKPRLQTILSNCLSQRKVSRHQIGGLYENPKPAKQLFVLPDDELTRYSGFQKDNERLKK